LNNARRLPVLAVIAAAALVGGLAVTGAAQPRSRTGTTDQYATVQVRHDLLGLRAHAGVHIDDAELAGRASVTGKLLSITDEFVALEMEHNHEVWIPRGNVLLIHIRR
jgi:hypothetical protein